MDGARVVVVGGGIAGVSVAYELAARARVVLVEAEEQLAHHTTGRSAAMYLQSYGNPTVRALTVASADDFARLARDLDAPPLLSPRWLLWAADEEGRPVVEGLEADAAVEVVGVDEALRLCPALRPDRLVAAAVDRSGSDIDVAALHQAYVRGLVARGGEVRRGAPVAAVDLGAGVVRAGGEDLRADLVVDAAGAWVDEVAALAGVPGVGIDPRRRTLFTTPVDRDVSSWPMVLDASERFYFLPDGAQLLVSPADETPSPPCDARPDEVDIARTLDLVGERTTLGLRHVRAAWAGLRSFVADGSPVIGAWPEAPTFAFSAGQGGYGIQMAPALARAAAGLLLDGTLPADVRQAGVAVDDVTPERLRPSAPAAGERPLPCPP